MKLMNKSIELLKTPLLIKISVLAFASFYLGKYFSNSQPLVFYSSSAAAVGDAGHAGLRSIAISPNANLTFDASVLIPKQTLTLTLAPPTLPPAAPPPPPILSSPPPPFRFGIVDENGTMRDDFEVGEFDPNLVERWDFGNDTSSGSDGKVGGARVRVRKYRFCDGSMREYIPCLDNAEEIGKLKSKERGEVFERHCPKKGLDCLVPAPKGYKVPIPWPRSRDE